MCCHLCRLEVPSGEAHEDTPMHRAALLIAVTALDHVRSQAFPDKDGTGVFVFAVPSAPNSGPTQPQAVPTTTFSFGSTDSPTGLWEPSPPSPFATNISGNCATANTAGSKPLFPAEIATTPSFKAPIFGASFGGEPQTPGTALVKYNSVVGTDEVVKNGGFAIINVKYHYITAMKEYENKSFDELRWEDFSNRIVKADGFLRNEEGGSEGVHLHGFAVFERISAFDFGWCDYCQQLVAARAHVAHQRSKLHIDAAYQDQMFMEAVQGYVEEEDLKILEGSSTDGVNLDPFKPENRLDNVYNCGTCGTHFVPVEFKKQHEGSIRHRACLALAGAACRRLRRHLAGGGPGDAPGASDAPGAPDTTMRDLLYAYRYPPTRINTPQTLKPPSKEYITRIFARLERIGTGTVEPRGSYTIIFTDDAVIVQTAVIMAVDWLRYFGVRVHGQDHKECYECGGMFKSIEGHLETAEHVKYVLAPIDEHGVRQIDPNDSMCLLCGDKIWSFDVSAHVNQERHIKNRTIALNRGKMYTEAKDNLKFHLIVETGQ